jgi:NADH:ubiquinone oxidoreductase subunit E
MVKISVCIGSACHLKGSYNVINALQQAVEKHKLADKIEIAGSFCTGNCGEKVSLLVNKDDNEPEYYGITPEETGDFFDNTILPLV